LLTTDLPSHTQGLFHPAIAQATLVEHAQGAIGPEAVIGRGIAHALLLETVGKPGDFMPAAEVALHVQERDRLELGRGLRSGSSRCAAKKQQGEDSQRFHIVLSCLKSRGRQQSKGLQFNALVLRHHFQRPFEKGTG